MLRHQLAVARRQQPRAHSRLRWPDRAWLALLAGTMPAERLAAMRLIVTPGTILRWHRDIVRRRWARRSLRAPGDASQGVVGGAAAGPGERVVGIPADPRRARRAWHHRGAVRSGRSSRTLASARRRAGTARAGRTKVYVLAVIEHGTRRIRILGTTGHPVQSWVVQ